MQPRLIILTTTALLLCGASAHAQVRGVTLPSGAWLPCDHPAAASQPACRPAPPAPHVSCRFDVGATYFSSHNFARRMAVVAVLRDLSLRFEIVVGQELLGGGYGQALAFLNTPSGCGSWVPET